MLTDGEEHFENIAPPDFWIDLECRVRREVDDANHVFDIDDEGIVPYFDSDNLGGLKR